jgi:hypothetical protein
VTYFGVIRVVLRASHTPKVPMPDPRGGADPGLTATTLRCVGLALLIGTANLAAGAAEGPVVGWGYNASGQATPPAAVGGHRAAAIAAGDSDSYAIQAGSGAVVCWGRDFEGQASPPGSVDGSAGTATAIAAGRFHSCAIRAGTQAVVCWGLETGPSVL